MDSQWTSDLSGYVPFKLVSGFWPVCVRSSPGQIDQTQTCPVRQRKMHLISFLYNYMSHSAPRAKSDRYTRFGQLRLCRNALTLAKTRANYVNECYALHTVVGTIFIHDDGFSPLHNC